MACRTTHVKAENCRVFMYHIGHLMRIQNPPIAGNAVRFITKHAPLCVTANPNRSKWQRSAGILPQVGLPVFSMTFWSLDRALCPNGLPMRWNLGTYPNWSPTALNILQGFKPKAIASNWMMALQRL